MRKRWRRILEELQRPHSHDPYNLAVPFRLPPPIAAPLPSGAPAQHYTTLVEMWNKGTGEGWRARCACGWLGPLVPTEEDAAGSALEHWDEVDPLD